MSTKSKPISCARRAARTKSSTSRSRSSSPSTATPDGNRRSRTGFGGRRELVVEAERDAGARQVRPECCRGFEGGETRVRATVYVNHISYIISVAPMRSPLHWGRQRHADRRSEGGSPPDQAGVRVP